MAVARSSEICYPKSQVATAKTWAFICPTSNQEPSKIFSASCTPVSINCCSIWHLVKLYLWNEDGTNLPICKFWCECLFERGLLNYSSTIWVFVSKSETETVLQILNEFWQDASFALTNGIFDSTLKCKF